MGGTLLKDTTVLKGKHPTQELVLAQSQRTLKLVEQSQVKQKVDGVKGQKVIAAT